ncbi:SCP2 sterol-binding domain-containing protein [Amaricoccus sp.]|uniref:SCP2 sterol-binding domain-containing protein n=1 Tax=Amaricoccus sp. TaxID=1872485 RepID=UPI00261F4F6F|nr:SCP2 sterol-binding domain-containing protein [Amaricoccus sp.]HRO10137.1 SCP2 sterol-binding domain-containing protein [Amaricoccus sp.]
MGEIVDAAVRALNAKLGGSGIDGSVKFVIEDAGAVRIDEGGAAPDDGSDADCTLTASAETFQSLLEGDLDPTGAFMSGQLMVDGDMGLAMRLGSLLA